MLQHNTCKTLTASLTASRISAISEMNNQQSLRDSGKTSLREQSPLFLFLSSEVFFSFHQNYRLTSSCSRDEFLMTGCWNSRHMIPPLIHVIFFIIVSFLLSFYHYLSLTIFSLFFIIIILRLSIFNITFLLLQLIIIVISPLLSIEPQSRHVDESACVVTITGLLTHY